jgi:dihydroorotase
LREYIHNEYLGHPRFFLGSDSAPHPPHNKSTSTPTSACAAGVYTSPVLLPLVAHLLESFGALNKLNGFVSENGRRFYGITSQEGAGAVKLGRNTSHTLVEQSFSKGDDSVVCFWAGKELGWEILYD